MRWHVVTQGRFEGADDEDAFDSLLDRFTDSLTEHVEDVTVGASLVQRTVQTEFDVLADTLDEAHRIAREAFAAALEIAGVQHFDLYSELTERILEPA